MPRITIHELPTEILMQVLTLTLPEDPWEWRIESVQQLALVCRYESRSSRRTVRDLLTLPGRRWLGVVLSTPGLWPTVDSRQSHRTITAVLAHNPAGPLNIRLREAGSGWRIAPEPAHRDGLTMSTERFVNLISAYAQRWRDVDIMGSLSTKTVLAIERAEAMEYLQLLVIGGFRSSTQSILNISRLTRMQRLRISGVQIQWDDSPKLPLLRILTVSFTTLPPIRQLHALLTTSTMLESISFHNIDEYPRGVDEGVQTSQPGMGFDVIPLSNLTNMHLNMVPSEVSTHFLTHLACPGPLSLAGNHLNQSPLQNQSFTRLMPAAIINFQRIRVDITGGGLRVHTDSGDRIKDRTADADGPVFEDFLDLEFTLANLGQMTGIAQNLGLLLESKCITLTVRRNGSDRMRVARDIIQAIDSIDDIWVVGGRTLDELVGILLEKCLGELGDSVWPAPRLQYLAVQDVLEGEEENAVSGLCRLWEQRYASLKAETSECFSTNSLVPCLPLHRLLVSDERMVERMLEEDIFPELMVDFV